MHLTRAAAFAIVATALVSPVSPAASAPSSHVVPVEGASYARTHHDYPAADIFTADGCGAQVVAPTAGRILQIRRIDRWRAATDNPAARGGKSIALLGDDGVRYYLAHLASIETSLAPGTRVRAGRHLGTVGRTGKAGSCHLHFGISPPCGQREWQVRRGAVSPQRYLTAWRNGKDKDPGPEVRAWKAAHPDACAKAAAAPHAAAA